MDIADIQIIEEVDVQGWLFQSSINPGVSYELESADAEPVDFFDYRSRYLVKKIISKKQQQRSAEKAGREELKFAFCFSLQGHFSEMKEVVLADFLVAQGLARKFKNRVYGFEDVCVEVRDDQLDVALIHSQPISVPSQSEKELCLLQQLGKLLQEKQLVNVLISLVELVIELTDNFFYEFEIENFNILVVKESERYQVKLVNQLLPIYYHIEFKEDLCDIYEEQQLEFNEVLALKKVAFLLITLSREESVDEYKSVREMFLKHRANPEGLRFKSAVQSELFRAAMVIVEKIEKKEEFYLAGVLDLLTTCNLVLMRAGSNVKSVKSDMRMGKQSVVSQNSLKSKTVGGEFGKSPDFEEEIFEQGEDDEEDEDDYYCVPAIDHQTLKLKIQEENDMRQSRNLVIESDADLRNGCQSMRSLDMLVGSSQVMVQRVDEINNEGGHSTTINVNQNRSQSRKLIDSTNSIGGLQSGRATEKRKEQMQRKESLEVVSESGQNSKVLKFSIPMKSILMGEATMEGSSEERQKMIKEPDFSRYRDKMNYRNLISTFTIENAHSDKINCLLEQEIDSDTLNRNAELYFKRKMVSVKSQFVYFLTGSNDCTIKAWLPFQDKPFAILEEDAPITHFIKSQNEGCLLYICGNTIKLLSIFKQKSFQMFRNDTEITSATLISLNNQIISFGTTNGMIKDFDIKSKCIIRRAGNIHNGRRVTAMTSRGKFLASASADGLVIIYDYYNQQEYKELNCDLIGLHTPRSLLFLSGESFLMIGEASGLTIVSVEDSQVLSKVPSKDTVKLIGLPLGTEAEGSRAIASTSDGGVIRIWKEGNMETRYLDLIKALKSQEAGEVSDCVSMPNGAIVSCGVRNIQIWEEKNAMSNACGTNACCTIF